MNDLTALKLLANFMQRVNVTGVEEAQALIEVTKWIQSKEKQILESANMNGRNNDPAPIERPKS